MSYQRIGYKQRQSVLAAASAARAKGPVSLKSYDAVDLAVETDNYFWQGLDNQQANAALRLVNSCLTWGPS